MFIMLEGVTVSSRALKTFDLAQIAADVNVLIEALPEEGRPRRKI